MKLRNKSDGEILEIKLIQTNCECLAEHEVETLYGEKLSLKTLNKYYDDYTPAEPLIKDEKIRKAVRAWAEMFGVKKVHYLIYTYNSKLANIEGFKNDKSLGVEMDMSTLPELKDLEFYTIAELCGEEEE